MNSLTVVETSEQGEYRPHSEKRSMRARENRHAHIFLHIQKTAGTSMRRALEGALPKDEVASIYPDLEGMSLDTFVNLPEDARRHFHLIFGHFFYGMHVYLPHPSRYSTFLRDPLERVRSNYWQTKSFHPARGAPLSEIVMRGAMEEFDNYQTRIISAVASSTVPCGFMTDDILDIALRNIREGFEFVGVVERIERDWPRLLDVLGLDRIPLPYVEPRSELVSDADYNRIDWSLVARNNRFDIALYNIVKNIDWPISSLAEW